MPIDDNAVEPAQVALGAVGGAALAAAAVLVAINTRRTGRPVPTQGLTAARRG